MHCSFEEIRGKLNKAPLLYISHFLQKGEDAEKNRGFAVLSGKMQCVLGEMECTAWCWCMSGTDGGNCCCWLHCHVAV